MLALTKPELTSSNYMEKLHQDFLSLYQSQSFYELSFTPFYDSVTAFAKFNQHTLRMSSLYKKKFKGDVAKINGKPIVLVSQSYLTEVKKMLKQCTFNKENLCRITSLLQVIK